MDPVWTLTLAFMLRDGALCPHASRYLVLSDFVRALPPVVIFGLACFVAQPDTLVCPGERRANTTKLLVAAVPLSARTIASGKGRRRLHE